MDIIWIFALMIIVFVGIVISLIDFVIIPEADKWNYYYHSTNNKIGNMTCNDLGSYLISNVNNRTNQLEVNLYDYAKVRFDTGGCIIK